mmetsp:Transcript_17963/g.50272  ORF Transcript_17963/g.50272 Transcript_17963/m.50272 type:complete len:170 (-) Transcript_17963:1366-1875(-)
MISPKIDAFRAAYAASSEWGNRTTKFLTDMAAKNFKAEVKWTQDHGLWTRRFGDSDFVSPDRSVELRATKIRVWAQYEDKIKPKLKEVVAAFFSATTEVSGQGSVKMMVKDRSSGHWTLRSGLQWPDAVEAVCRRLWQKSDSYAEGRSMPENFTTTGLTVSNPPSPHTK